MCDFFLKLRAESSLDAAALTSSIKISREALSNINLKLNLAQNDGMKLPGNSEVELEADRSYKASRRSYVRDDRTDRGEDNNANENLLARSISSRFFKEVMSSKQGAEQSAEQSREETESGYLLPPPPPSVEHGLFEPFVAGEGLATPGVSASLDDSSDEETSSVLFGAHHASQENVNINVSTNVEKEYLHSEVANAVEGPSAFVGTAGDFYSELRGGHFE